MSYIHLCDEFLWGLLTEEETCAMGAHFLMEMARCADVPLPVEKQDEEDNMKKMARFLVDSVCARAEKLSEESGTI